MSPYAALVTGLFALLNLLLTFWVKENLQGKIDSRNQLLIDRAKGAASRESELYAYLEFYFLKLDTAIKAFTELCSDRSAALDAKSFVPLYSEALGKWADFTTYSQPKETIALSPKFLWHLTELKEKIDRLTIALSLSSSERVRRRTLYESYLSIAVKHKDEMIDIYRKKYEYAA